MRCTEYRHGVDANICAGGTIMADRLRSLAFSRDGRTLVSAGEDGRAKIWSFDGRTLTATGTVITASAPQMQVAFTPDGTRLVVGGRNFLRLYDTQTWAATGASIAVDGDVYSLGVTSDGRYIVSLTDNYTLFRHDVQGAVAPLSVTSPNSMTLMVLAPVGTGGRHVAYARRIDGTVAVVDLDAPTLSVETTFEVARKAGDMMPRAISAMAVSPDGRVLAVANDASPPEVLLWSLPLAPGGASSSVFAAGTANNEFYDLGFAPDSRHVAGFLDAFTRSEILVGIWELVSPPRLAAQLYPGYTPLTHAFSPSGAALAIGYLQCGAVSLCVD
jgi:WD40 repeat protein